MTGEATAWKVGDRVMTASGPGVVVRETPNARARSGAVGVRLDGDTRDYLFLADELKPEVAGVDETEAAG